MPSAFAEFEGFRHLFRADSALPPDISANVRRVASKARSSGKPESWKREVVREYASILHLVRNLGTFFFFSFLSSHFLAKLAATSSPGWMERKREEKSGRECKQ